MLPRANEVVMLATTLCCACGTKVVGDLPIEGMSSDTSTSTTAAGSDSSSGETTVVPTDLPIGCDAEERDDGYVVGLEKSGDHVRVRLLQIDPPPPARGDSRWSIEVVDLETGVPREDFSLTVEPYMPDHLHGTAVPCEVTHDGEAGQLTLDPVNLFMPGLWEVRLHFEFVDLTLDFVQFSFCVEA
jgi:YtkA-like protein